MGEALLAALASRGAHEQRWTAFIGTWLRIWRGVRANDLADRTTPVERPMLASAPVWGILILRGLGKNRCEGVDLHMLEVMRCRSTTIGRSGGRSQRSQWMKAGGLRS